MNLNPSLQKTITSDWGKLFPQFAMHKPMILARRIGPMIQGICLDKDSSNKSYLPTSFCHSLCRPFPVLSLTLGQPLISVRSGMPERISVELHEEKYRSAAERIRLASFLPMEEGWTSVQVLDAVEKYRETDRPDSRYPVILIEDVISMFTWLDHQEQAKEAAEKYLAEAETWPEAVLVREGGIAGWREKLRLISDDAVGARNTVAQQISSLNLMELPVSELVP